MNPVEVKRVERIESAYSTPRGATEEERAEAERIVRGESETQTTASGHADLIDTLRRLYATEALPAIEQAIRVIVQQEQAIEELHRLLSGFLLVTSRSGDGEAWNLRVTAEELRAARATLRKAGL